MFLLDISNTKMHKYARNNLSNIIFEEIIGFFIFFGRKGGSPQKKVFSPILGKFCQKMKI